VSDFFIYLVKPEPEPDLSPTYLMNFKAAKSQSLKYESQVQTKPKKSGPTQL
jgi:hypothetical protein